LPRMIQSRQGRNWECQPIDVSFAEANGESDENFPITTARVTMEQGLTEAVGQIDAILAER
jgi:hypothetical protein